MRVEGDKMSSFRVCEENQTTVTVQVVKRTFFPCDNLLEIFGLFLK